MVKQLILLTCTILFLWGCKSKRMKNNEYPYQVVSQIEDSLLNYRIIDAKLEEDSLLLFVRYGGGCIKPHIFELVQKENSDSKTIELHLLHHTTNDRCRALIRENLAYDLKPYFQKNHTVFLNGQQIYPVFQFQNQAE